MAVPSFLSTEYGYTQLALITDVQDIIDELVTVLTGLSNPWSHSTGTFTSPQDAGGNYVEFTLTRISATNLEVVVVDHVNRNMLGTGSTARRMQIPASGDRVSIFYGENYVWVETLNPSTVQAEAEHFGCGLLDLSPEDQDAHNRTVWARARRSSGDSLDAHGDTWTDFYMIDNAATGGVQRRPIDVRMFIGTNVMFRRISGKHIYKPVDLAANDNAGTPLVAGRMYQAFIVIGSYEPWSEIQIPVDDSPETLGTFKVTNCREDGTNEFARIALRIA